MKGLIDKLKYEKGKIVCSSSLSINEIENARATNRFYVDKDGIGFAWIPDCGFDLLTATTEEEAIKFIEAFEKYYPIHEKMPDRLKDAKAIWDKWEKERKLDELSKNN